MQTLDIQQLVAHDELRELLGRIARYGHGVQITNKDRPVGWLVGNKFMETMSSIIEHIIEYNPQLADTLAITLDPEIRAVIEEGTREIKAGKLLPLESILDES